MPNDLNASVDSLIDSPASVAALINLEYSFTIAVIDNFKSKAI